MVVTSPHGNCNWCGVLMGLTETESSELTVEYGNATVVYNVCYKCRTFLTPELLGLWRRYVLDWALLNIPIRIVSQSYNPVTQEGEIKLEVMYSSDLIPVRIGWVA